MQDSNGQVVMFPQFGGDILTVFVKFFDPVKQELEFLGCIRPKKLLKGFDLVPMLTELKKLPPSTSIKIFEVFTTDFAHL